MKGSFRTTLVLSLVTMVLLASAIATSLVSGSIGHSHAAAASDQVPYSVGNHHPDIKAQARWFQLSHFGKQQPSANSYINARAQAARLPVRAGDPPWTPLGPQPINSGLSWGLVSGRVTAEAVDPTYSGDLWVGTADGGVWNSFDGGHTWSAMTDNQPTTAVGSIAVDPNNPYTVYVGTGEANFNADAYWGVGVLKSTNHGSSWTLLGNNIFGGLGIGRIAVDPANSNILLLSAIVDNIPGPGGLNNLANVGIWRSTDGGISWQHVLSGTEGTDVIFDPANPNIAFAGLGSRVNPAIAGVYKSTDNGQTWTLLSSGIPTGATANIFRVGLGISSDGTHVYAVLDNGATSSLVNNSVYVSTNTGATWTAKAIPPNATQDFYNLYVAVDPSDSTGNTAYVGQLDVFQTTDGGTTWTNLTHSFPPVGPVHPDQHALAFFSKTSSSFYIGNDGGVWSGTKAGAFTNLNAGGLNLTQFYGGSIGEVGPDARLYGGSQDNGEDQYPVGAPIIPNVIPQQWTEVFGGDGGDTAVDYTNNAVVYEEFVGSGGIGGQITKSTDGGATWVLATTGINPADPRNFIAPFIISPSNHNELFAGTDHLYITTNGAATWTAPGPAPDPGVPLNAIAVAPSNDSVVYVGDNNGKVFRTTNGGVTWTGGSVPGSPGGFPGGLVRGLAVDPTNPNIVYVSFADFATGAGHHVFKSTNGGATWTDISTPLPNIPFSSILISTANGVQQVIVGSDVGVFVTQDGGLSWASEGFALPNVAIDQVFMNLSGTKIFVATHGRGMWQMDTTPIE